MAFGLMHDGLSTDELLQGTPFKTPLEERMHVWDDIIARITDKDGIGETVIPGSTLTAHLAGSRGVRYLVNRGPCFTHVDPMDGFLLGLDPVKDSIRTLGRRSYSINNLTILLGIRDPESDLVTSFEEILDRARLDLVQGKRKDELVAFVNATSQMSMTSARSLISLLTMPSNATSALPVLAPLSLSPVGSFTIARIANAAGCW